jgi:hypothetical protein
MRDDEVPGPPDARIGVRSRNMPANFRDGTLAFFFIPSCVPFVR